MFFFTERVRVRSQQICQRRYMKGDNNIVDLCINILENIIVKCAKATQPCLCQQQRASSIPRVK